MMSILLLFDVGYNRCNNTVLSGASAHKAPTPPTSTVLWFFRVLSVTAHHAIFSCSESNCRSAGLSGLASLVVSSTAFSCHLQYANFVLQEKNTLNEATDGSVRTFDA